MTWVKLNERADSTKRKKRFQVSVWVLLQRLQEYSSKEKCFRPFGELIFQSAHQTSFVLTARWLIPHTEEVTKQLRTIIWSLILKYSSEFYNLPNFELKIAADSLTVSSSHPVILFFLLLLFPTSSCSLLQSAVWKKSVNQDVRKTFICRQSYQCFPNILSFDEVTFWAHLELNKLKLILFFFLFFWTRISFDL